MDKRCLGVRQEFADNVRSIMRSIMWTYPGFQSLPRGIKQMLVASENDFFSDAKPVLAKGALGKLPRRPTSRPASGSSKTEWPNAFSQDWKN